MQKHSKQIGINKDIDTKRSPGPPESFRRCRPEHTRPHIPLAPLPLFSPPIKTFHASSSHSSYQNITTALPKSNLLGILLALHGRVGSRLDGLALEAAVGRRRRLVGGTAEQLVDVAAELDVVVGKLAHLAVVQAHLLLLGRHAQAQPGHEVHEEQDDAGQDERVRKAGHAVGELVAQLDPIVVEPAAGDLGETVEVGNVVTARAQG